MNLLRILFGRGGNDAVHARLVRYTSDPRFTRVAPARVLVRR